MKLTTEKITQLASKRKFYVVKDGNEDVGVIYTFPDTKTEQFPWTILRGVGAHQDLIGHVWGGIIDAVNELKLDLEKRVHYNNVKDKTMITYTYEI